MSLYGLPNAILAQLKNCHVELALRLRSEIQELHPTIPAHSKSKHAPLDAIIVGCSCYIF